MEWAVRIRVKSKLFISSLNISVQMTQQQRCTFQLKSARCLSTVCKCQLHGLYGADMNYNAEAISVKGDLPRRNPVKPRSSKRMEKPRARSTTQQGYGVTETCETTLQCFRHTENGGGACFHPVHCFDGFQKVFKMSHIRMFWGSFTI